jgi:hypothetical protein
LVVIERARRDPPPAGDAVPSASRRARDLIIAAGPTALAAVIAVTSLLLVTQFAYRAFHPVIDQVTYAAQADALRSGDLTIPNTGELPLVFTAPGADGLVTKYLPGTAALGAASLAVGGGTWLAAAAMLVLLVVATSGLAAEAGLGPRSRALAGLLVGLSPCVLALDARLLSYVPGVAIATAAAWAVVAGARTGRTALLAVGGLTLGVALLVRQLEVMSWAIVLVVWLAATAGSRGAALRRVGVLLVATLPGLVLVALYDRAVTGSAMRLPYVLVSPDDGPGFGLRRALGTAAYFDFDLVGALRAAAVSPALVVMWTALGPLLALGTVLALRRPARPRVVALLVALAAAIPLAFVLQWSHKNALRGGHYDTVGPFYLLFVVPPLVVLGVVGWRAVAHRWPLGVRAALVVGCVGLQTALLWGPAHRQIELDRGWRGFDREVAALEAGEPTLLLVDEAQRGAQFPELSVDGRVVAVSVPDSTAAFAALDRWPGRDVLLATQEIVHIGGRLLPVPRLVPLEAAAVPGGDGATLDLRAEVGCPRLDGGPPTGEVLVLLDGQPAGSVGCGPAATLELRLAADRVELWSDGAVRASSALPEGASSVALCATAIGPATTPTTCRRLAVSRSSEGTKALVPGQLDGDSAVMGMDGVLGPLTEVVDAP